MDTAQKDVEKARALLAQFNKPEGFDHVAFLLEMDRRSCEMHGRELTQTQQRHLARLVAAYLDEVRN